MGLLLVTTIIKFVLINLLFLLPLAAVLTWMERRQSAFIQDRVGPTRAYIPIFGRRITAFGLIHVLADSLKMFFKESFVPARADRFLFKLAPLLPFAVALVLMALIPFGPDIATRDVPLIGEYLARRYPEHPIIPMQIARLDAGMLLVFAIAALGIYGVVLGGWASNNRYALLGSLRAAAQAVSYEVTLGLSLVGVFLMFGSTELSRIVAGQSASILGAVPAWGIIVQPLGALLFFVAAIAENKRTPFDLPEAESEIIGYFVEYSSMGFGMFMLSEYLEVGVLSSLFVTLFLGGHELPWVIGASSVNLGLVSLKLSSFGVAVAGMLVFGVKVFLVAAFGLQLRWTLPRFRYDQLMRLGWKSLLPLALVNILISAVLFYLDPSLQLAAIFGFALAGAFLLVVWLGPTKRPAMTRGAESEV